MKNSLIVALMLAMGCGPGKPKIVDEQTFILDHSVVFCHRLEECLEGVFYSEYIDQADCQRDQSGELDDLIDDADDSDCDFEVQEAQECSTVTFTATCEQFYEYYLLNDSSEFDACDEIFDC